ncbi:MULTISPECIES: tRNA lysidine(34) synthetase TilS [unclassified Paenibacillus]|uniref:tRNA lysidine(34) synthetase TilS n=1 Tax=unclassified Paenibacillus TaxID=185978 RepID=UPI00240528A9|nr:MULTISPECIES: tRNA lysidine(34) synthetase TilS [unclassified Paenibacillus]MDF9844663.1 tRNA(Ile)-lysidine synthase [Paenibacillus sp. PastF-2]MDF9851276.1 tRNA(Ile)-lysidine synthase [Paenibacillus sp. PastM-2]MDF9857859.1 tRNA(Ile)-lysidine synthase [Paenibacillus sp. PastF-1]MDH6483114.1 tRNA(Ile)-lysidine synthase [Paenibacillus sp. PastH-2]MDH6510537.1 tRNA(Ile)-lysidine synthase [Paenibacillus sp. PastM-3]
MEQMNGLVQSVMESAAEHELWAPHDTLIVAVSGGPDSVALLRILHEISLKWTPLKLVCAHVNHGFREESIEEAGFVRALAGELGIPFELAEFDIPSIAKSSGLGPEGTAREKRYRFLIETARRYGARAVALAHHADDQAETVLMRLLRGSGPSGLAGMRWKRTEKKVELIRPFLRINKTALIGLCQEQGYPYVLDASNLLTHYQRNAVRLELLPMLEKYNPKVKQSLLQLSEITGAEDEFMEANALECFEELVLAEHGKYTLQRAAFAAVPSALQRRLIKLILNYLSADALSPDFLKIEAVRRGTLQEHPTVWTLDLGGGLICVRQYDTIVFSSKPQQRKVSYTYRLSLPPSRLEIAEIGKAMTMTVLERESFALQGEDLGKTSAWFDSRELAMPLTVRSRLPGDTIRVMGLNGSKKVKDIYIDDKIPSSERSRIPLVCDAAGNIVWIPGVRRSMHAAVGRHTATVLLLTLEELEKSEEA